MSEMSPHHPRVFLPFNTKLLTIPLVNKFCKLFCKVASQILCLVTIFVFYFCFLVFRGERLAENEEHVFLFSREKEKKKKNFLFSNEKHIWLVVLKNIFIKNKTQEICLVVVFEKVEFCFLWFFFLNYIYSNSKTRLFQSI